MTPTTPYRSRTLREGLALGAFSAAALACATLTRAVSPTATPQPPPTPTASPLTASEELQRSVPSSVAGLDIRTLSLTGADLDASDPAVAAFLTGLNPSEVEIAASTASDGNGIIFQAGAIRVPGRDWSAALEALAASTGAWERITLANREVLRGQDTSDSVVPPIYYLASGDTLYYVQSSEAGAAEETIGNLPGGSTSGGGSGSNFPPPGSSPLVITIMQRPLPPLCVGAPPSRQHLMMMALDTGLGGVPSPYVTFTVTGQVMASSSPPLLVGPLADLPYAAARYGGGREQLTIEAHGLMGGTGFHTLPFDVQHCLYGTWQDDARVLRITPPNSDAFTAEVQSGTLCEEGGGTAFSGTLAGDRVSGSDLKTCSPKVCVDAGFIEKLVFVPFSGVVADDGLSITIDWTGPFYQWEEDNQGNVLSCVQTSTEDNSFTITRLTFGD